MPGHDGAPPYIVGTSHFHAATEVKIAREKHVSYAEACKGGAPAAASAGPSTAVDALVNGLHEPAPPENVIEWAFLKAAKRLLGPDAWPTDVVYAIMPPPLHDHCAYTVLLFASNHSTLLQSLRRTSRPSGASDSDARHGLSLVASRPY